MEPHLEKPELTVLAVVADPAASERFAVLPVRGDSPRSTSEALVRVKAFSLNGGEVRNALAATAAERPGWDLAGVIEQAAQDGSGPPAGTRIVGFSARSGAWAELVHLPTLSLCALPDSVGFAAASTLPVAGLTALLALEKGGQLLGRRTLITGASGSVGRFACQLALLSGAHVTANLRHPDLADVLRAEGVHEVTVGAGAESREKQAYDVILETQGGASLARSMTRLRPGGVCVVCGNASNSRTEFEARQFYMPGGTTLYGFNLMTELEQRPAGAHLGRLLHLLVAGVLRPSIDVEASWLDIDQVARRFGERAILGKAVLHIDA